MKRILFIVFTSVSLLVLGACEKRSAEVIFPEYVAKKKAKAEAKLSGEAAENAGGAGESAPQFFRESDSR
jgi:hypothetical protein